MTLPHPIRAIVFDMDGTLHDSEAVYLEAMKHATGTAGMMTIMVPDLVQPTPEIRALCARVVPGLDDVHAIVAGHATVAGHTIVAGYAADQASRLLMWTVNPPLNGSSRSMP